MSRSLVPRARRWCPRPLVSRLVIANSVGALLLLALPALAACPVDRPYSCKAAEGCWPYPVIAVCKGYHGSSVFMPLFSGGRSLIGVGTGTYGFGGLSIGGPKWPPIEHFAENCDQLLLCNRASTTKPPPKAPSAKAPSPKATTPKAKTTPPAQLPGGAPGFPLEESSPQ